MTPIRIAAAGAAVIVGAAYALRGAANTAAAINAEGDGAQTQLDAFNPWGYIERQADSYRTEQAMQEPNVTAFLSMIASAEGTNRARDPYRVCYAYAHTIASFADHPAVTGEWRGEKLPDAMCRGANLSPGCVSTAAGRYQLIKPTWLACKRALGLVDFTPASQDAAAVYLIRQRGALADVQAGRIADAIEKCRKEWASLPGAGYGQPERQLAALLDTYQGAGGALA